jgi:hypothetical protein
MDRRVREPEGQRLGDERAFGSSVEADEGPVLFQKRGRALRELPLQGIRGAGCRLLFEIALRLARTHRRCA